MIGLSASTASMAIYYIFGALIYACIAAILVLGWVFGRRARRNVKKERVTHMPKGCSPLDVQRVFIGKTYPRRLTKALIVHWAQMGYIKVKQVSKYKVILTKRKNMPQHYNEKAVFFDRGTYVRERDLFNHVMKIAANGKPINLLLPLVSKSDATYIAKSYAAREDEGVYSATHYTLKVITFVLSVLPLLLSTILLGVLTGNYFTILLFAMALIGLIVLIFVKGMPILFKAVWCGVWLSASVGMMLAFWVGDYGASGVNDVMGVIYASIVILFVGPIVLIRFVDYREKINLDDYSDLMNYRKFLLTAAADELSGDDYYAALPFLYAFNIKWIVGRKFKDVPLPNWYESDCEQRGALL